MLSKLKSPLEPAWPSESLQGRRTDKINSYFLLSSLFGERKNWGEIFTGKFILAFPPLTNQYKRHYTQIQIQKDKTACSFPLFSSPALLSAFPSHEQGSRSALLSAQCGEIVMRWWKVFVLIIAVFRPRANTVSLFRRRNPSPVTVEMHIQFP